MNAVWFYVRKPLAMEMNMFLQNVFVFSSVCAIASWVGWMMATLFVPSLSYKTAFHKGMMTSILMMIIFPIGITIGHWLIEKGVPLGSICLVSLFFALGSWTFHWLIAPFVMKSRTQKERFEIGKISAKLNIILLPVVLIIAFLLSNTFFDKN